MQIESILKNYGLSQKQATVYVACLELGTGSVQKIARKARLPRSTVYEVLEGLKNNGFVSTYLKKKVRYFSAEEPGQIIKLAEQKTEMLKNALPQLNALAGSSRKRPSVRFYEGKDGMKLILKEVLDEANELVSFGSAQDLFVELGDYFHNFVEKRIKKKIPVRVLLRDSKKARERKNLDKVHIRQIRLLPDKYPFHGIIFIWKNKIAMFSFVNDFVAIVTESKELSDMQKAMFEHLWDLAE